MTKSQKREKISDIIESQGIRNPQIQDIRQPKGNNKMKKFYICEHCGNIIEKVNDSGVPVVCCGQKMKELVPGTVDASREKHIPEVEVNGDVVNVVVGSVEHPMTEAHSIQWIYLETDKGSQIKYLKPDEAPRASFSLNGEKPIAVYEYCNLHGLWVKEI